MNLNYSSSSGPVDLNAMIIGTNKDIEFDTPEMCIPAFLKLQKLVQNWHEHMMQGSEVAEKLLQNFYNWLSNPESKLYDP